MRILALLSLSIGLVSAWGQNPTSRYWVFLNETSVSYSQPMLGPDAIARRTQQGIPLTATDFALQPEAAAAVAQIAPTVGRSRWLRAVVVDADSSQIARIASLPLVGSVQPVGQMRRPLNEVSWPARAIDDRAEEGIHSYQYGASLSQVTQIQANALHDAGFDGAGVKVALMDGGYAGADTYSAFQGAWQQGRVLGTWDYIDGDTNVFHLGSHGMSVWSTMCADLDGSFVGTAPKASYYLFKTENQANETIAEEHNWVMAAERADSLGVDVINTSLGYTTFDNGIGDHSYADMNGRTTPISRAAVAAARVGMIVCVSAGNEGASSWKYISAPADADSILAVGAVDAFGQRASFSSQGPSSDGRVKPDVSARGLQATVINANGNIGTSSGTSFSSPILAGAMASLVQAAKTLPSYSAQDLVHRVRMSANRSFAPDSFTGYGIPNFATVLGSLGLEAAASVTSWSLHTDSRGAWILRRSAAAAANEEVVLYAVDGRIVDRWVLEAGQTELRGLRYPFWAYLRTSKHVLPVPAYQQ